MEERSHPKLKSYQREHRDSWNQGLSLRVHRALSWLDRAEQEREKGDRDAEFLFLWISFNAAYASEYTHDQRLQQRDAFASAKRAGHQALAEGNVVTSLSIIMDRLYTLRNQLVHGGATWNGSLNREQLRDACGILGSLLPIVISLMMQHGTEVWGDAAYFIND